jgi:hypothetical protein
LTHTQLEQLRNELDALVDESNPPPNVELLHELHYNEAEGSGSVLFHCLGHWRISPGFHDILFLDSICVAASQLLQGRSVRFWHDQAFVKPAGHGAVVQVRRPKCRTRRAVGNAALELRLSAQWHQDFSYWDRTGPMAHLTVCRALTLAADTVAC